jgi:hypothetical protein
MEIDGASLLPINPDLAQSIAQTPVLINGDDIVFYNTNTFIRTWKMNALSVGFVESVGKCYESQDFMVINSTLYPVVGLEIRRPIPFINMGIISGMKKGESDEVVISLRQKMGKLVGAFVDAFDGADLFDPVELSILSRVEAGIMSMRRDVVWSGLSKSHLGLFTGRWAEDQCQFYSDSEQSLRIMRSTFAKERAKRQDYAKGSTSDALGALLIDPEPLQAPCYRRVKGPLLTREQMIVCELRKKWRTQMVGAWSDLFLQDSRVRTVLNLPVPADMASAQRISRILVQTNLPFPEEFKGEDIVTLEWEDAQEVFNDCLSAPRIEVDPEMW